MLVNFVSGFRLELMYISLIVNIRLNLNHLHGSRSLYCCHNSSKSLFLFESESTEFECNVKVRQASNRCKRVLEAAKLEYATKKKESIPSQKLGSRDFWRIANSVLNMVNLLYLLYSTARRCCLLQLIKQNCLLKTFLRSLILMTRVSLYLLFLLELIRWLKRS